MKFHKTKLTAKTPLATHTLDADGSFWRLLPVHKSVSGSNIGTDKGYTIIIPITPSIFVPREIKNWQAKAVLESAGVIAAVNEALESLDDNNGIVVRAAWNGGESLKRNSETVTAIGAALSFTSEQIDAWFIEANALSIS